jgi:hypothetical protein
MMIVCWRSGPVRINHHGKSLVGAVKSSSSEIDFTISLVVFLSPKFRSIYSRGCSTAFFSIKMAKQ